MLNKIAKYFREISVVIVGIVITFTGSDLITKSAKQREVKTVMELIKEELKDNKEAILLMERNIREDSVIFSYIGASENIRELSPDTLMVNKYLLRRISVFIHSDDAYELLKSSSLMQHVKNKDLMLKIMRAYDMITFKELQIKSYNDIKDDMATSIFMNIPKQDYEKVMGEQSVYEIYEYSLQHDKFWNFIQIIPGVLENAQFSYYINEIDETIALLDEEYGFN